MFVNNLWQNVCSVNMIKRAFTIKNEIEAEGSSRPKSTGILTVSRCITGPNLVILAWTGDKLLYKQAQNWINLNLQVIFALEDQGQSTSITIVFLNVQRYISGPNLVILNGWKVILWTSSEWGKIRLSSVTLKVKVDHPQK